VAAAPGRALKLDPIKSTKKASPEEYYSRGFRLAGFDHVGFADLHT
jgi:hypothetical protein